MACFFLIASISSYLYFLFLRKKFAPELSGLLAQKILILLYLSSYFGSRLYSILFEQNLKKLSAILEELFVIGSMVSYGGLITAGIIGLTYLLLKKENINSWFNLLMPSGLVALAIGRIGCFLNGDDCGLPTKGNPWWSITFSNHQEPIARLPLQILESSLVFLVVVILYKFQEKNFKFVGVFGLALYLSLRFWLSSYRFS